MAPGGARTEVCGVAPEVYPRPQFIRSNFGGNFAPMLKFAGYDAIVVTGRAAAPVWVDIRDERVTFRDAGDLWGLGFYDAEKRIWSEVSGSEDYRQQGWHEGTTQRAAVVGIGQCGENLSRIGCLVHGADTAAGCGGFGGVFGSKNLKAISVIGTGSLVVARPEELMAVWQWVAKHRPKKLGATFPEPLTDQRRISCFGCMSACKVNTKRKEMSGSVGQCIERGFYVAEDRARHGKNTRAEHVAGQLAQDHGINLYAAWDMLVWLESLHGRGLLGKGRAIDTDLDFDSLGSEEFIRDYLGRIAHGTEIGADLAEGWVRAAAKWGILEEELASGAVSAIHWGIGDQHWTNNVEWAYLSLFDARDCNAHDIQFGETLEKTAERYAELAPPWHDKLMLDQSRTGVYSIHCARLVSWHSRYVNMKGSFQWCDWAPFETFNDHRPDGKGLTPEMEERLYAAVTGQELSWEQMLEFGRRVWNFKRAILVLNGRHRDEEYFPPYPPYTSYVYTEGPPTLQWGSYTWTRDLERATRDSTEFLSWENYMLPYPVCEDGRWQWSKEPVPLDKTRMDGFKTVYYELEGWDAATGWPTRSTLAGCGLDHVADVLEGHGKRLTP